MACQEAVSHKRLGLLAFLGMALLVIILDQAAKLYIVGSFRPGETLPLINGIFHFTYVRNPGAAFGIFAHQTTFFIVTSVVLIVLIIFGRSLLASSRLAVQLALSLQVGGALGNLIDRVRFGYVIDFLDFQIWPVFNFADMAIVAGIILLLFSLAGDLFSPREGKEP